MPRLQNVLAGIPGLAGYEAARQGNQQADISTIQQAGALQKILAGQRAAQQERELQGVVAQAGGDPKRAIEALLRAGTPQSIELAAKLKGLVPDPEKPAQPQLVTVTGPDGKPMQRWVRPGESTGTDVGLKYETPEEKWSPPYQLGGATVQRHFRTGEIRTAVSRPPADRVEPITGPMPAAAPGAGAMPSDVRGPAATGGSGFFGGIANTVADMVGAPLPYQDVERATQALKNLRVQTITLMQDAVPGRPSNYLMQQIEQLAVTPGSLFQADERARERLTQTRNMLKTEVGRMEREVLAQPRAYTAAQLNKTRQSHGQLRQLMGEYDRIIDSFNAGPTATGAIGGSAWNPDKERRYQELLRKQRAAQ